MPIKDPEVRRKYFRELMRERRAGTPKRAKPEAAEIERLRNENQRLQAELAALRRRDPSRLPETVTELQAQRRAFEEAKKAKRAAGATRAAENYAGVDEATLQERLQRAELLHKADQTRIRNLTGKVRVLQAMLNEKPTQMPKRLHQQVLNFLHPDRAGSDEVMHKRLQRCFQEFSAIKFKFPPED